jgi:hypothetical protein
MLNNHLNLFPLLSFDFFPCSADRNGTHLLLEILQLEIGILCLLVENQFANPKILLPNY